MQRKFAFLFCLAASALTAGCGTSNSRIPITGTVSYKGEPIEHGSIAFSPKDESKGTPEGAVIANGKFALPPAKGLFPGEYIVSISMRDGPAKEPPPTEAPGAPRRTATERLPEQFNKASTLRIEVTANGKRAFDFPLD